MGEGRSPSRGTALVHDWLTGMRGGEKVLEAVAGLRPTAPIFSLIHRPGSVSPAIESHRIETSFLQRVPGIERHYRRYLPLFPQAIEAFDLTGFDTVVSLSHCVAKGIVPAPDAFHLCYCFTPMRYAWDQEHQYFPRRHGPLARIRTALLSRLRVWDVTASSRVDEFLTISRFVAARIEKYYRRSATVVAPPVDVDFYTPGEEPPDRPFALVVAALVPYKRVEVAIEACSRVGLDLVVVGDGPDRSRLEARRTASVRLAGRVPADELRSLYRRASLYLQPGVEDFGIATVESLACETPIVARARGGVLDIVEPGRHGVLYHEPPGADGAEILAAAIDKGLRIRFNSSELRRRSELFSADRFLSGFRSALDRQREEGSPP